MKPEAAFRIGAEAEKFGVFREGIRPLGYLGNQGIVGLLTALIQRHGWSPYHEVEGGPMLALERGNANVTLEPGCQLELSGAPHEHVHLICAELHGHMAELNAISKPMGLEWLGVGFHPFARREDLDWVPKARYPIMRRHLPTRGSLALDMMLRTATVQANFDFSSEADAMRKLRVSLRISPIIQAMFANSPFIEGKLWGGRSARARVWLDMDPDRSGCPEVLFREGATLEDYIEWGLDVPMFLIRRGDEFIDCTSLTFRSFMKNGAFGHRATDKDWEMHLNTLFPEVRLKRTLEVRCADSLPTPLACALPAIWGGILYDPKALSEAEALCQSWDYATYERERRAVPEQAMRAQFFGKRMDAWAAEIVRIAEGGLERRGRLNAKGENERVHLRRLIELVGKGQCPADALADGLTGDEPDFRERVLDRARV